MIAKNEEKGSETSLGSKILDYVPWRMALTVAAFAIPVIGPVVGTAVGALMYANYRKNNKTKNPASDNGLDESSNKGSKKESAQPSRLARLASEVGTIAKRIGVIAIGFLLGGPIGGIIAIGLMVVDGISGGKVFQIVEKVLDAGYNLLSGEEDKIQDAGKLASDKMKSSGKEVEKEGRPTHSFSNPAYFPERELGGDKKEVNSAEQLVQGDKAKAELRRRENSNPKARE